MAIIYTFKIDDYKAVVILDYSIVESIEDYADRMILENPDDVDEWVDFATKAKKWQLTLPVTETNKKMVVGA